MRKHIKLRRPSQATVVAYLALFIASGSGAMAASHLGKNTVGTKQLKKNSVTTAKIKKKAVTGAKVKNQSLTGENIKLSKLGTVPEAAHATSADSANTLVPPEAIHLVGAPGEPPFLNGWKDPLPSPTAETVGYYKDHEGIVRLTGVAVNGSDQVVFQLPPGYRPANGKLLVFAAGCIPCAPNHIGVVEVSGTGPAFIKDGAVAAPFEATSVSFDGITFRAGS